MSTKFFHCNKISYNIFYNAVPFFGINKWFMSACSSSSSEIFLSIPPAYPVRLPFVPTTRWQGMIMEISLCPTAPPTAWADIWEVYLQNISYIKRLFMATYIISIIYSFDHNVLLLRCFIRST